MATRYRLRLLPAPVRRAIGGSTIALSVESRTVHSDGGRPVAGAPLLGYSPFADHPERAALAHLALEVARVDHRTPNGLVDLAEFADGELRSEQNRAANAVYSSLERVRSRASARILAVVERKPDASVLELRYRLQAGSDGVGFASGVRKTASRLPNTRW